jgi:hypothetical protein
MSSFNPGRYVQGVRRRKTRAPLMIAIQLVSEQNGWTDKRVAENRKPSMPRVKFLEAPPPELYGSDDWRELVRAWNAAHGRINTPTESTG